jgi:hypothetical protein
MDDGLDAEIFGQENELVVRNPAEEVAEVDEVDADLFGLDEKATIERLEYFKYQEDEDRPMWGK